MRINTFDTVNFIDWLFGWHIVSVYFSQRKKHERISNEKLPPTGNKQSLVGNEKYTIYQPAGKKYRVTERDANSRSLPNSGSQPSNETYKFFVKLSNWIA